MNGYLSVMVTTYSDSISLIINEITEESYLESKTESVSSPDLMKEPCENPGCRSDFIMLATVELFGIETTRVAITEMKVLGLLDKSLCVEGWALRTPAEIQEHLNAKPAGIQLVKNRIEFGASPVDRETQELLSMLDLLEKSIDGWE